MDAHRARPHARRARRAVRDRARPRRAARRGARVPRADRPRLRARRADPLRRPRVGRARGLLGGRRAAVHRRRTCASPRRCARRWRRRSAARELFSRLESLAYQDPLTRLPNRRALDERLEEAVARGARHRARARAAVLRPRRAQGRQRPRTGHEAGDRALVGRRARRSSRRRRRFPGAFTSRLGGDEFCVLMEGHGADAARALARDAAHRLAAAPGGPLTFSCGVACLDDEHRRSADLFRAADAAQYAAKRVGGGKLFVAEPGIPTPADPGARAVVAAALPRRGARTSARRSCASCSTLLDADLTARASWRGSRPWPARSPRPSTPQVGDLPPRAGLARRARRCSAPSAATATTRTRPTCASRVEDETYALADYPLTARGAWSAAAASRSRPPTRAPTRASARCSPSGASPPSPPPRRSRPDGSAWLVELFSDRAHARAPGRAARAAAAGRRGGRARARRPATTPTVTSRANSLEDLDVALQVRVGVQDRQRPLLVDARAS